MPFIHAGEERLKYLEEIRGGASRVTRYTANIGFRSAFPTTLSRVRPTTSFVYGTKD